MGDRHLFDIHSSKHLSKTLVGDKLWSRHNFVRGHCGTHLVRPLGRVLQGWVGGDAYMLEEHQITDTSLQ